MSKKINTVLLEDLVKTIVDGLTSLEKVDTKWIDDMINEEDKSINELLKETSEKMDKLDEMKQKDKKWQDKLKMATEIMNKNIEKAVEQVSNKERKVLIDSPVNVKGDKMKSEKICACGCEKPVSKCDCNEKKNDLNVSNAFSAESLKEKKVKLINVNKTAEKILAIIYDEIKKYASTGSLEYDFMDERWDSLLLNVRVVTVEKVLERVVNHLVENGFAVSSSNVYDEDGIVELYMSIDW